MNLFLFKFNMVGITTNNL